MQKTIDFVRSWDVAETRKLAMLAVVSGVADAALLITAGTAVNRVVAGERPTFLQVAVYAGLFATSNLTLSRAVALICQQIERHLRQTRERIVDTVRRADLLAVERLGSSQLYTELTQDFDTISLRLPSLLSNLQDAVVLVITLLYVAWLSMVALGVLVVLTVFALTFYNRSVTRLSQAYHSLIVRQTSLTRAVQGVIDGFSSLRLNQRKTEAVTRDIEQVSLGLQTEIRALGRQNAVLASVSVAYLFAVIGSLAFIVPTFDPGIKTSIIEITTLVLFCMAPLTGIASSMTTISELEARLGSLQRIEAALASTITDATDSQALIDARTRFGTFSSIEYRAITFIYRGDDDERLFTCGPIDFTLARGELVFVVGGNGSGKSTFMNLLCGLYTPNAGTIHVDGVAVTDANRSALREQFAAVFADFHLFDRFYGHDDVPPETVNQHLTDLSLDHKVTYRDGAFSTTELSSGQRKRLAMAAALVDDKPIYLFDEWTADQDAEFRGRFYAEILPRLKAQGKTCIVVTHDDRYWSYADRVIKFEGGRIVSEGHLPATASETVPA